MVPYDLTMRHLAQAFPREMAEFSLGRKIEVVEPLNPDLPAFEQRGDFLGRIISEQEEALLQIEFQTAYRAKKIRKLLSYRLRAGEIYDMAVFSS